MMKAITVNKGTGLLSTAIYHRSPHADLRPENVAIDMIVVHCISLPPGEFGGGAIEDFFCGQLNVAAEPYFSSIANLRVSAHLLIKRSGEILQFVPFHQRAWHAGESFYQGKAHCNDFSIGIELQGADDIPYEQIQYQQLATVAQQLMQVYPSITKDRIVGHVDIAPGRKTDPGPAFDWTYLKGILV